MFVSKTDRVLLVTSLTTLVLLSLVNIWPRIYGIASSSSYTYPEGWNAYNTATVLQGRELYGTVPKLTVVNYPPLFYHIVALCSRRADNIVTTGRLVSILALLLTSLLAGRVVFRACGEKCAGALASALVFTWLTSAVGGYMATNEPQMLAHALVIAGLVVYVELGASIRGLLLTSILFCVALFVKNNVIAVPLAVSLHLLLSAPRRCWYWVVFNVLSACALLYAVIAFDGSMFIRCLLAPRSYDAGEVLHGTRIFVNAFQVPLVVAVIWCYCKLRVSGSNLFVMILAASLAVGSVFRGGGGTNFNMFFDAIIGLALVCSIAIVEVRKHLDTQPVALHLLALSPLLLCVWPLAELGPGVVSPAVNVRRTVTNEENEYLSGVAYMKSHPGPAICETIRLCFDSGKDLTYDPYYVRELVKIGRLKESEIMDDLRRQRYSIIQFDSLFDIPSRDGGRLFFSTALMNVIREYYRVGFTTSSYMLLVPRTDLSPVHR